MEYLSEAQKCGPQISRFISSDGMESLSSAATVCRRVKGRNQLDIFLKNGNIFICENADMKTSPPSIWSSVKFFNLSVIPDLSSSFCHAGFSSMSWMSEASPIALICFSISGLSRIISGSSSSFICLLMRSVSMVRSILCTNERISLPKSSVSLRAAMASEISLSEATCPRYFQISSRAAVRHRAAMRVSSDCMASVTRSRSFVRS